MPQNESINTSEDYINYTFHISSKGTGAVAGELIGLSNTVSNLLGDIAFKTSEMLSHTETLAIGTSVAVGALFTSAIQDSIRFEQQMANVKAIGGESLNAQEIGSAAMEYSNKFGMAVASMTEGLEALARAGITTTSVMKSVLEEGVKLSKLEGMDLEDSINDLIATTNLLAVDNVNMNDAQYAEMVKTMNQHIVSTSESAPINAQNIIQSLQHVGGYASASGMDQDDLFAVIAQLGSRGTKGEMAGTALRAFIAAGQKDTAQRALARIGLNVSDLWNDNGETMLSISEMKDVLDDALEARGYSKQEKLEFYSDFAGYKQANQIMKIDTSEVQQYKEQIANAWDLGTKLNTILNTVKGNLDRIWQITQNFMTKVGGKILFVANAILTPVRMLLELINNMPFADTAFAAGMIVIGFTGVLKIINNIVPRFSTFFIQLSQVKKDAFDIRNVWKKIPDDITKAKDVLEAMSDPKKMIKIQQDRQLYSRKEVGAAEDKVARIQFIRANLGDKTLHNLNIDERKKYLSDVWANKDSIYKENFLKNIKVQNPEEFTEMMRKYFERAIKDSNSSASKVSYDIEGIITNDVLWDIDNYVAWIYRIMNGSNVYENKPEKPSPPSNNKQELQNNRQRNAEEQQNRATIREIAKNIRQDISSKRSEYGDYSYKVNPDIGMPQIDYNNLTALEQLESQIQQDIQRKINMYADFLGGNSSIEAGRTRLKKSLTVGAKTDLGYEFSTGANTSDIKKILETGKIREGASHILDEQIQTIAEILDTNITGNKAKDMRNFSNILNSKNNKDELLESILNKTQKQWNDKYYNNGQVGYFPTHALESASGGVTAQRIMDKVGNVSSIAEVQQRFKNVALDDQLLNECVDIMYEDKDLVEKLVKEEIKYMYENLIRVQNSILDIGGNNSTFQNKGEEYTADLQKAREYVLSDFNPRDFADFTLSPFNDEIYSLPDAITFQNDEIINSDKLEGYQQFIFPLGTDIAYFQRYGKDFPIRNIRYIPYNDMLQTAIEEPFLDYDEEGERYEFLEAFADWSEAASMIDKHYWDTTFDFTTVADYFQYSDLDMTLSTFEKLKQEFEDRYRTYIASVASDAQSLIESQELYGPTLSFRAGSFFTPENEFGAFDTITSTSLVENDTIPFRKPGRSFLEIYNPEDNPAVIGHYNILNKHSDHLWSREHELTLPSNQPYLHMENPDDEWKMLLMLTADQQQAVKEIMGEDFEFAKNAPTTSFLNAGEVNPYDFPILLNQLPILNKDNLTKDNIGLKLKDLLENGAISVDTRYQGGALGSSNSDGVIDINTGSIRYHADNYNEEYGDYGNALLDTVLHEMTHILMMHAERQNYQSNNIPKELGIDNFQTSQLIQGYNTNFVAEYEAQYVSSQVLNRLGIEATQKSQQRMAAFKDLIENKGYGDQIQYELLDNLVDEMLNNISTIGDITKVLSTQFDMFDADVKMSEVSEDMRPILSKIQAFNKDTALYQGPQSGNKAYEVEQVLSDMEKDMEFLWVNGISDKELIYNLVAQKYMPYIETLEGVNLGQFLKFAAPNFKNQGEDSQLTESVEKIWDNLADGGDLAILNKIKKHQLHDPLIRQNAPIFMGTWGDKRFNSHINQYLRRTESYIDLDLDDDYTNPEMKDILTKYDINTIAALSTILSKTLLQAQGLPFDMRLFRRGKLNTARNNFGILTGVTSTAYERGPTDAFANGYGNDLIEMIAPAGTQGMNLYDWEYTLAPNTPYIELGQYGDATRILLLPPKQQQKYGFYPEGLDDSFRIGVGAAVANNYGIDEDVEHFIDGIHFDDRLYDNEEIVRGFGMDGLYYYYNHDNDTILASDYLYDTVDEIDESFISAQDVVLNNFNNLKHLSKETARAIVSNFIASRLKTQGTTPLFKNAGEDVFNTGTEYNDIAKIVHDSVQHFYDKKTKNLSREQLYEYISDNYGVSTGAKAEEWLEQAIAQTGTMLVKKNKTLRLSKNALEAYENYYDPTRIPGEPENVILPSGASLTLPTHSGTLSDVKQGGMNKYLSKRTDKDIRQFIGLLNLLDSDLVRSLDEGDITALYQAITTGEGTNWRTRGKELFEGDVKVGDTGVLNVTTAADCINRGADAACDFCDFCYAWIQAFKPNVLRLQLDRAMYFRENTSEQIAQDLRDTPYKKIRISQEGDFRSLDDYLKVAKIAELNPDQRFYGYTKVVDVLNHIYEHGTPKNLQINNSLGTWDRDGQAKGNYIAKNWQEVLKFLEQGYKLCQGACEDCKQCLYNIDKITILRTGSEPIEVGEIAHLNTEGQKAVFKALMDYNATNPKATKTALEKEAEKVIASVSAMPGMLRNQKTVFQNAGEEKRLPELGDYYPKNYSRPDGRRNDDFIKSLNYGGLDQNIKDFLNEVDEIFIWEDNNLDDLHRKRRRTDDHWGTRELINYGYANIGSQTDRLLNYGLFYNRQRTRDVKEGGFEEIVNLFNTNATKKAYMSGIISSNQLQKWHKQLQGSVAVDEYGEVPWGPKDVEEWKKEKDEADKRLADLLEQRQKKTTKILEMQNEVVAQTLQMLSLMPVSAPKTQQATLDPLMTQTKAAEFGMPELVENSDYINYKNEVHKKQERQRAEQIRQQYSHISGAGVNVPQDHSMPGFSSQAYVDFQNQYAEQGDYLLMNKWDKARYKLNQDGQDHKIMHKGIDIAEWLTNTVQTQSSKAYQRSQKYAKEHGSANLEFVQGKMGNVIGATKQFRDTLSGLAEVFPILTPAVEGLNIALQAEQLISTGLGTAIEILNFARVGETESTFLQTMANWANSESALQAAAGQMVLTGVTWLASAAEAVLAFIRGLGTGTLLILAAAILAVVAAVELLKFWENKHAEALKESQKALEEATAKNNIALSQYKDLKKARESETDAIRKQQAARKEAIALYELEAARVKRRKAIHDEAKLRNDGVWGEYGLRASMQKMGLGFIAGGDFESQYEKYDGTTANIRQVKEASLGNLFASQEQRYVSSVYDNNSMFFAEIEAYQDSLGELYDKESKLIDQYGSIDAARDTKEFREAVQEFADATGLNGETAVKMLDWLETENRVNQATQAMKAQTRVIVAKADAKAIAADFDEESGLGDMDTLQHAMIMSQAQDIYQDAYDYMWWEKFQADLFGILWTIVDHLMVWDWTDHAEKYWKKSEAYQEGMKELSQLGVRGLTDIGDEMANGTNRRDYGTGAIGQYHDTPFGGALESQDAMMADYVALIELERRYANEETQKFHQDIRDGMNKAGEGGVEGFKEGLDQHSPGAISRSIDDEMIYTQQSIQENSEGVYAELNTLGQSSVDSFKEGLGQDPEGNISKSTNEEMLYTQQAFEKNKEPIGQASYEVGYEAGEQYGKGFVDGLEALYAQVSTPEALAKTLEDRILVRQGYGTPEGANPNDPEVQKMQEERRTETESKLLARGFSLPSLSSFAKSEGKAAYKAAKSGGLRSWKDTSFIGRIANAAEIGITEGSASKGLKALFAPKYGEEFGVKGAKHAINKAFGRETGEAVAKAPTGKIVGKVDNTLGKVGAKGSKYVEKGLGKLGIESGESFTEAGGKFIARNFGDDAAKVAVKGGSKLAKMGAKALPFVGTAITAATSIAEHNPFEKHYNEDGSEKRALQSSGEVAGEVAGALASDVVGVVAGPVAGMAAGLILEPIGEAIGGTIGWMADEVVNTKFTDAWGGFNDALGGIPNQIVGFIDQSPIGQAGHAVWDGLNGLTGGWLGDTWENVKNSSIAELTGLDQLGGALQGAGEWLFGGGEGQEQVPTPDQITDEQIMQLEKAGMLDEYMAQYGLDKEQQNVFNDKQAQKTPIKQNGNTIIIKNININTEDDPEKIKSALMNLIIEMQEQISPRQVSRTMGEPPATQSTSDTQNTNNTAQTEGTDAQSGTPNGNQTTTNNNNPNPT